MPASLPDDVSAGSVDRSIAADVVEGFRHGDEGAVRQFYRHYHRLVFAVSNRVLSDRSFAEEATQQTFVQAWRAASTFELGRDPAPWLATIARRVAIDIQRREARRPAQRLDTAPPGDTSLVELPPSMEAVWEAWQVRDALDSLGPGEREVMRLQHFDGLTHNEIADRLGVALGTVKSRSFRAHRDLAHALRHLREPMSEP